MSGRALGVAFVILGSCVAVPVTGQERFAGLAGGATLTDIAGPGFSTDSRWGATAGLLVGYRRWDYAIGMLELNWIQKGGRAARIDYLEIPMLIGGSTPGDLGFSARIYTGLSLAIPIGCDPTSTVVDCGNKKSPEFSWPLGVQIGRATGPGRFLGGEVRYFVGLSDVFNTVRSLENRGWQFRLVTTFPLGG